MLKLCSSFQWYIHMLQTQRRQNSSLKNRLGHNIVIIFLSCFSAAWTMTWGGLGERSSSKGRCSNFCLELSDFKHLNYIQFLVIVSKAILGVPHEAGASWVHNVAPLHCFCNNSKYFFLCLQAENAAASPSKRRKKRRKEEKESLQQWWKQQPCK